MKRLILPVVLLLGLAACTVTSKVAEAPAKPSSVEDFLREPFGFPETVKGFHDNIPNLKETRVLRRNKHYPEKSDTIYKLYTRKSSLMIYKTYLNKEILLGGAILDNRLRFKNGLTVGSTWDDVQAAFTDLPKGTSFTDTLMVSSEGDLRSLKFVFDKKGRVKKISFYGYVD